VAGHSFTPGVADRSENTALYARAHVVVDATWLPPDTSSIRATRGFLYEEDSEFYGRE